MGWVHYQDFSLGHVSSGTSVNTGNGASQSMVGNWITVFIWGTNALSLATLLVTDNAQTTNKYTFLKSSSSNIQSPTIWCVVYEAQISSLPVSGNLVITVQSGVSGVLDVCASEWSGGRGSKVIDTQSSQSDLTGNPATGTIITGTLDGLILATCVSQDGQNPGTITVPNLFTSVASELNGSSFKMGNACYYVTSGSGINSNGSWTFDSGAFGRAYAALQVTLSLKSLPPQPTSLGVSGESTGA